MGSVRGVVGTAPAASGAPADATARRQCDRPRDQVAVIVDPVPAGTSSATSARTSPLDPVTCTLRPGRVQKPFDCGTRADSSAG
jgi:hypothetical protein